MKEWFIIIGAACGLLSFLFILGTFIDMLLLNRRASKKTYLCRDCMDELSKTHIPKDEKYEA